MTVAAAWQSAREPEPKKEEAVKNAHRQLAGETDRQVADVAIKDGNGVCARMSIMPLPTN